MKPPCPPFDPQQVRVYPLSDRKSHSRVPDMLVDPQSAPVPFDDGLKHHVDTCADQIRHARQKGATVSLIYGAHLVKNGASLLVRQLIEQGWITHVATNGAGTIHDWEFAFGGQSTESVRANVAAGCFGTWEETGKYQTLALLVGNLSDRGYGESLGRLIDEEQLVIPSLHELHQAIANSPTDTHTAARAELWQTLSQHAIPAGIWQLPHPWKTTSILQAAYQAKVPFTVHPGIGYDIIATHPIYSGAAVGRAAAVDFVRFGQAVSQLEEGVVLSVGSAIMGPQVFEKSLSCVNNVRQQHGLGPVSQHTIYVVDLQDGGGWDWTQGEPPTTNPAYYLRFCKSYARMGGTMHYLCCDNLAFVQQLYLRLCT